MINRVFSKTRFCFIPQSVQVVVYDLKNELIIDKNSLSSNWLHISVRNNSIPYYK